MALSLLTSVLIVWLYVGRNIVRRLTGLSDGMLAIAGGRLQTPVAAQGADEIAAMGRAVEIFRKNTLERDQLLEEKAQAAERLELQVKERTAELAQSVEELRALGDVSQAVNSTIDLETVLSTIVAKAVQLSGTDAGAIYVFDDASREFRLRATYGMDDTIIAEIRDRHVQVGESAIGEAADAAGRSRLRTSRTIRRRSFSTSSCAPVFAPCWSSRCSLPTGSSARSWSGARKPGEFPKHTVDLLQTFAAQSVLAIQNAQSVRGSGGQEPSAGNGEPAQVAVPRQHEPRAAHAAQRHHRRHRDDASPMRRASARRRRSSRSSACIGAGTVICSA